MSEHPPARRHAGGVQLTPRDRELLAFAAEHRFVLGDHVGVLLHVRTEAAEVRLRSLTRAGYLSRRFVYHRQPSLNRITALGLRAIGSALKPPRLDLHAYEHDIGVAWLWLAAHRGAFGSLDAVIGERRLRSRDAKRMPGDQPLAVRLGGRGEAGAERLHYPDLLLIRSDGSRVALELELTAKGRLRTERILGAYEVDDRIAAVLYLVTDKRLGRSIAQSARRLGIAPQVQVQLVSPLAPTRACANSASRTRTLEASESRARTRVAAQR